MVLLHTLLLLQGGPQPVPPPHPCRPLASACQLAQAAILKQQCSAGQWRVGRPSCANVVFAGTSSNLECSSAQLMLSRSVGRESVVSTRTQYLLGSHARQCFPWGMHHLQQPGSQGGVSQSPPTWVLQERPTAPSAECACACAHRGYTARALGPGASGSVQQQLSVWHGSKLCRTCGWCWGLHV